MSITWRRRPQRLTVAVTTVAAVLVGGLTYAGLDGSDRDRAPAPHGEHAAQQPSLMSEADAVASAARADKRVEATALRTAYSTTWAEPDGSLHRRIHASPIRAKVDGSWKPIDPTLARTKGGWSPKATNTQMIFSAGSHCTRSGRTSRSQTSRTQLTSVTTTEDEGRRAALSSPSRRVDTTWS